MAFSAGVRGRGLRRGAGAPRHVLSIASGKWCPFRPKWAIGPRCPDVRDTCRGPTAQAAAAYAGREGICALGRWRGLHKAAAAAGVTRLAAELEELAALEVATHRCLVAPCPGGRVLPLQASDVRSILAAAPASPPGQGGRALVLDLPKVPTRRLSDYATETARRHDHHGPAPVAELEVGLRRLKLSTVRRLAPS